MHWSALFSLEYLDLVQVTVIDPMHNIFLRTAQCILDRAWLNCDPPKITKMQLGELQSKIDAVPLPADMGRIPLKVASRFTLFMADQWKMWTLIYSTLVLCDILSENDWCIWQDFVDAISI